MDSHLLFAYRLDGNGRGVAIESTAAAAKEIKADRLAWVHLNAAHPETRSWLAQEIGYLDPFILEALLADGTRPRVMEIGNGVLVILRGVNLNENAAPEDMVAIRLWIDNQRIISIRRRPVKAARDIEARLLEGKGPKDSGEFLCMLISRLFERMEPVLLDLDEATDDVEEKVLEQANSSQRDEIIDIRKQAILFRRYMAPQRDAINQLRMTELSWLKSTDRRQLIESHDRILRYVEDLDAIRERAQIVKDELANILSDRLNKNMYVLSVVAAVFLPLGFLTGLLGINVGGIPGAENPQAFGIFLAILAVIVTLQILLFKKLKWF